MAKQVVTEGLVQLDPGVILADDNSRFGLKQLRVESLMQSILEQGGVMQPIEVEPILGALNGKPSYRLTSGFYRHAAVSELNATQNAGLTLPAIVKPLGDPGLRLKRQLAENMERENQSPMDKAIAIKKLVDAGVSKVEIRKIFSTPGGRKGLQLQPASNAFVNMTLSFLDLPKAIQDKVHDGRVGVAAAYELTKVDPEKRAEILAKAEADRLKAIDKEEKDEQKFLESEKKALEAREKEVEAVKKLEAAKTELELAKATAAEKRKAAADAYIKSAETKGEDKPKMEEAFKALQADAKAAERKAEKLDHGVAKASDASKKAAKLAAEKSAMLANARKVANEKKPAAKGKTVIGSGDVKKAAADLGAGYVKLPIGEVRRIVHSLGLPGVFPKVREFMIAVEMCFDGIVTDGQLYTALAVITGHKEMKPAEMEKNPALVKWLEVREVDGKKKGK